MRARMLERLGAEAADAIDELLNLALAYDDGAAPSLQGFLSWLREGTRVIKRDMEQGRDEVRVMTVHGAKGLEAPIVFLPDTCSTRSGRPPGSLLELDRGHPPLPFVWPVKGTSDLAAVQQAKAAVARAEAEERNRLLYVAVTRARDRLYVAGFEGSNAPPADCWYNLIRHGLGDTLEEVTTGDGGIVWRIASTQTAKHEADTGRAPASGGPVPLPAWARKPASPEPLITVPLAPSRLAPLESDAEGERVGGERDRVGALAESDRATEQTLALDGRSRRGMRELHGERTQLHAGDDAQSAHGTRHRELAEMPAPRP
jgi:ATP-dependent helicase/nuclease subunit A